MPGIAAIFAPRALPQHADAIRRMLLCMRHHPDSVSGSLVVESLGLTAGWVAHAGSQAASDSAAAGRGPVGLLLSGECERRYGLDAIDTWDGTFAGLLIDRRQHRARLFNDRYGIERLYVVEKADETYVASEAKALLAVLPELRAFDEAGVAQFLAFGSTLGCQTLFRGLCLMPGGSEWIRTKTHWTVRRRYFEASSWENLPALSEGEFQERLDTLFPALVARSVAGNDRIGLSLTGGLDTRMIVACLPRLPGRVFAYTYAAEASDQLLDLRIARRVAEAHAMRHTALRIGDDFTRNFSRHLDRTAYVTDGLAGVLGAHELMLSEQARAIAPVRLTGNFGSEILRSMSTFKRSGAGDALLAPEWRKRVHSTVDSQTGRGVHPVTHAAFEEIPWHLAGMPAASRSQMTVRAPFMANAMVELAYRAPPSLRLTPRPCQRLIHRHDVALAAMPTDRGLAWPPGGIAARWRHMWCSVTFKLDYWHKQGLPDRLTPLDGAIGMLGGGMGALGLHKFLAYRLWFRRELASYAAEVVSDPSTRRMPFWAHESLRTLAVDHATGRCNRLSDIHAVLSLSAVQRNLLAADIYSQPPVREALGTEI